MDALTSERQHEIVSLHSFSASSKVPRPRFYLAQPIVKDLSTPVGSRYLTKDLLGLFA